MKKKILFLFLTLNQNILADQISSDTKQRMAVDNFTKNKECETSQEINGKDYCLSKSTITLNSCGPMSDWPCIEERGCLVIDKFTLKN